MKTHNIIILSVVLTIIVLFIMFFGVAIVGNTISNNKFYKPEMSNGLSYAIQQCDLEKTDKDFCYLFIFEESRKLGLHYNESIKICDKINSQFSDQCYLEIFRDIKEPNIVLDVCKKIKSEQNTICYGYFYDFINTINDPDLMLFICKNSVNTDDWCYNKIIDKLKVNEFSKALDICKLYINDKVSCYNRNLFSVSERIREFPDKSSELCKLIGENVDSCLNNVAWEIKLINPKKAVSICSEIDDAIDREGCYYSVWLNFPENVKSDPDLSIKICGEYISTQKNNCYYNIASILIEDSKADARNACEEIRDEDYKRSCLYKIDPEVLEN